MRVLAALLLAALAAGGAAAEEPAHLSQAERRAILSHGPWPPKPARDPSNRASGDPEAIGLGRALFFDPRLSAAGTVSCATCHDPARAWTDGKPRAAGQSAKEVRQRMLDEIRERCYMEIGKPFPMDAELIVRQGNVAEQVTRTAIELGAELIVVGMKGRSALAKLVLGDATGAILERAPCPVVVIPPAIAHPTG